MVEAWLNLRCAETESRDTSGRSILSWAAGNGHERVVQMLFDACELVVGNKEPYSFEPYNPATQKRMAPMQLLLDSRDNSGRTPLAWAAMNGHEAVVRLLLSRAGTGVPLRDRYGQAALSLAAEKRHRAVVNVFLKSEHYSNWDMLHANAIRGYLPLLQLLLETRGAEIDQKNQDGRTPLSFAAEYRTYAVMQWILTTYKVGVNSRCRKGRTPLSYAAETGDTTVVQLLLDTGRAFIDSQDSDDYSRHSGTTPLAFAAAHGRTAVVKQLLGTGKAGANIKDDQGWTPLFWAAERGYTAIAQLLINTPGVEVDSADTTSRTPLSWAAENGHEAVVRLLMDTGKVRVNDMERNV